jgi:signal transduction histidine kinase
MSPMAMRPLEKLPTIRAKLGSVIVFAVAMTLLLVFLILGYTLRESSQDTRRLHLVYVARTYAIQGSMPNPGRGVTVVVTSPGGVIVPGQPTPPTPIPTDAADGQMHVGRAADYEFASVPIVRSGVVVQIVFAFQSALEPGIVGRAAATATFLLDFWWQFLLAGLLGAGISLVIARWLARGMTQPLRDMAAAAQRLEQGDYTTRVHVRSMDEVGQLAAAFNRMSAELEDLERSRRDLVANVSHELKTPIAAIRAHLENLADGVEAADPETLQVMLAQTERLTRLVDQLLDLSRLESGEVPFQQEVVGIAPLVERVISEITIGRAISDIRLEAEVGEGLVAEADPERIHQVLFNLVDNAVRFTPPGGEIRVTARRTDGRVEISVADTGVGIAAEHLPRVFERFYRVDASRSRDDGGTGIGLAIARSIVEGHGGRIVARSDPGRGSTFTFDLPAAVPAVAAEDRRGG